MTQQENERHGNRPGGINQGRDHQVPGQRLPRLHPHRRQRSVMWRDIFLQNREGVLEIIQRFNA
jgi:hypothetical protein